MTKKLIRKTVIFLAVALAVLTGCSKQKNQDKRIVKLGLTQVKDQLIFDPIKEELKKDGVDLQYVLFTDYVQPDAALEHGDIDINSMQTYLWLKNEIKRNNYHLTSIGYTLIAALDLYSQKIKSVDELKDGDTIAISSDAISGARGLAILQAAGIIKLKQDLQTNEYNLNDIVENPKNIKIVQIEPSQLPSVLPDVAAAIINGGFATDAGLTPAKDAIFEDNPSYYTNDDYINVIAVREADKDDPVLNKIVKLYHSERTKKIFAEQFSGLYVPAWD